MATTEYDLIVIGAGAVGENVADRAVQGGLTALIIEDELVGGECSYWACMPSKALLRSGMVYRAAQKVGGAREAITGELDVAATFARRTSIIHDWNDEGQVKWLKGAGIDLARGHGTITGVEAGDSWRHRLHGATRGLREHGFRGAPAGHPWAQGIEAVDQP